VSSDRPTGFTRASPAILLIACQRGGWAHQPEAARTLCGHFPRTALGGYELHPGPACPELSLKASSQLTSRPQQTTEQPHGERLFGKPTSGHQCPHQREQLPGRSF